MKNLIFLAIVIASVAVIIAGFFQPWAKVSTSVESVSEGVTGVLKGTFGKVSLGSKVIGGIEKVTDKVNEKVGAVGVKKSVSGFDVPRLVNNKSSKIALAIAQAMFKSAEGLDWKSYAVYLLPLAGIICIILAIIGFKNNIAVIIMTVLSGAISILGLYNLHTANLSSLIVKIEIGEGIWNTLYSFLVIAIVGILQLVLNRKKVKPQEVS